MVAWKKLGESSLDFSGDAVYSWVTEHNDSFRRLFPPPKTHTSKAALAPWFPQPRGHFNLQLVRLCLQCFSDQHRLPNPLLWVKFLDV